MPTLLDIAADLVSIEPASQATRLLGRLMEPTRASAGAVLVPSDQDLRVFVSRQASLERLSQGRSAVAAQRLVLQRGEAVSADGITLLPLTRDSGLIGVVLLEGGTSSVEGTDLILTAIVAAVMVAMAPRPLAGDLDQFVGIRSDELERHRLIELLKRNEWNLARVARVLGVTRRTVYMRLKRYDNARQMVPKTVKGGVLV
jgi:DNA-binding NtrC family response regulator